MSHQVLIVVFTYLLCLYSGFSYAGEKHTVRTVVIDAGHGGTDPGCSGEIAKEKDITLAIALKVGKYIEEKIEGVKVIYTRKTDVFIELHERADIANRNNADIFISIHCNANPSSNPYGTETYVMGLHKTEANLDVAKRENSVILKEDDYADKYDGFDPNSPEAHIIFSLYQNAFLESSIRLASSIESEFKDRVSRHSRGVHQAGFLVLYKTAMPSVLVETGFLTNKNEEKYLVSEEGQDYIASAVFRAFRSYKEDIEKAVSKRQENDVIAENEEVVFKIQIGIIKDENDLAREDYITIKDSIQTEPYKEGNLRCLVGPYFDENQALSKQAMLRDMGFKDAFIVAYNKGERISIKEARDLLKKN